MTPEEKAKELVEKFMDDFYTGPIEYRNAKACALICVKEMINQLGNLHKPEYTSFYFTEGKVMDGYEILEYWQQVKTSIQNL